MDIAQSTAIICGNCQMENKSKFKYCISCGYELPGSQVVSSGKSSEKIEFFFTDIRYALILLGISFGLLMIMIVNLTNHMESVEFAFALSFIGPLIVFLYFKKNIKRSGKGEIRNGTFLLELDSKLLSIGLIEIENYQVQHYNGTMLRIKLKNGQKYKIVANDNFCDATSFEEFTDYFESMISDYKHENKEDIVRKKSVFEQKWMFFFLVILSVSMAATLALALIFGKEIPGTLYTTSGVMFLMWAAYLKAQKRKKKK